MGLVLGHERLRRRAALPALVATDPLRTWVLVLVFGEVSPSHHPLPQHIRRRGGGGRRGDDGGGALRSDGLLRIRRRPRRSTRTRA